MTGFCRWCQGQWQWQQKDGDIKRWQRLSYLYDTIDDDKDWQDSEEDRQRVGNHPERDDRQLYGVDHGAYGERDNEIEGADVAGRSVDGATSGGEIKEDHGGVENRGDEGVVEGTRCVQPPQGNRVGRPKLQQAYNRPGIT